MPDLEGKHYPYTEAGIAAWKKAKEKKKKKKNGPSVITKATRQGGLSVKEARRLKLPVA